MKKDQHNNSSVIQEPFKLLYMFIPILLSALLGIVLTNINSALQIMTWILVFLIFGLITFPFSSYLFKNFSSSGFLISQPLGIAATAFTVWTLTHIGIYKFNTVFIIITMVVIAAVCYGIKPLRNSLIASLSKPGAIENMALEETVFALGFTILCYFKGFLPDINGQEKFMDYGFIMSMLRSSRLPANDMWLSGHTINYYYFGQYIYALLIKLSGIRSSVGYTLSMCSSIAMPFAMCYSIGHMLIESASHFGMRCRKISGIVCGFICAFSAFVFGNSHSFYYDETSPGNKLLALFAKMGINVGRTTQYYYPDSTRFIGYNPDSALIEGIKNGGDYTIEEFPFYSYLVGDLHAHVVSSMIVLLIVAVALSLIDSTENGITAPALGWRREWKNIISVRLITLTVLLGCAQMTNYWDFLIYFIFLSMTLLVYNIKTSKKFSTLPGALVFVGTITLILSAYLIYGTGPVIGLISQLIVMILAYIGTSFFGCALSKTSLGMSVLFTGANLAALSFNMTFDMISNKTALTVNHTSPYQFFILWGTHLIICIAFIVLTVINKNYRTGESGQVINISSQSSDMLMRFFNERNTIDIFVCGMSFVGMLLLMAPEIFYVRDIYTGGYLRANTMFKFTYAAFIILSICVGYIIPRLYRMVNKKGQYSPSGFALTVIFALMLLIPAHYPITALDQRCRGQKYETLDGTQYIYSYTSSYTDIRESGNLIDYLNAVEWFNTEVPGTPVIVEGYGRSYTDCDIISAYTGLPTICGWETHEMLWRYKGIVDPETNLLVSDPLNDVWALYLTPRRYDISRIYSSDDISEIKEILNKYSVEYIVIGDIERYTYGFDNTALLSSLGDIVFTSGDLNVIRIVPG